MALDKQLLEAAILPQPPNQFGQSGISLKAYQALCREALALLKEHESVSEAFSKVASAMRTVGWIPLADMEKQAKLAMDTFVGRECGDCGGPLVWAKIGAGVMVCPTCQTRSRDEERETYEQAKRDHAKNFVDTTAHLEKLGAIVDVARKVADRDWSGYDSENLAAIKELRAAIANLPPRTQPAP